MTADTPAIPSCSVCGGIGFTSPHPHGAPAIPTEVLAQSLDPDAVKVDGTPSLLLALSSVAQSAIEDVYADCGDSNAGVLASNVARQLEYRITAALPRVIAAAKAEALTEFADANRFPEDWILFQFVDGVVVTVGDLLRERAADYRKESE